MAENTNPAPPVSDGYTAEGRTLEQESLASTYPTNPATPISDPVTAAAGDTSEMLGEVLQSQALNPLEPAVTNDPVPLEGAASGRTLRTAHPGRLRIPRARHGAGGPESGLPGPAHPHRTARNALLRRPATP